MLLLSSLLTSSCSPIPSPTLLLTSPTCFGAISSVFVITYESCSSTASCVVSSGSVSCSQPLTGPVLRWPDGRLSFRRASSSSSSSSKKSARRESWSMIVRTAVVSGAVTTRMCVLVCLRFAAGRKSRRGAKKMPNSGVALKTHFQNRPACRGRFSRRSVRARVRRHPSITIHVCREYVMSGYAACQSYPFVCIFMTSHPPWLSKD